GRGSEEYHPATQIKAIVRAWLSLVWPHSVLFIKVNEAGVEYPAPSGLAAWNGFGLFTQAVGLRCDSSPLWGSKVRTPVATHPTEMTSTGRPCCLPRQALQGEFPEDLKPIGSDASALRRIQFHRAASDIAVRSERSVSISCRNARHR